MSKEQLLNTRTEVLNPKLQWEVDQFVPQKERVRVTASVEDVADEEDANAAPAEKPEEPKTEYFYGPTMTTGETVKYLTSLAILVPLFTVVGFGFGWIALPGTIAYFTQVAALSPITNALLATIVPGLFALAGYVMARQEYR